MYPWLRALVPGRHRALLGAMLRTPRSEPGSKCDRQVTQLLLLLRDKLCLEACVALLDGEEHWLTQNQSHALVDATLREALMRAWYDPCAPREREAMLRIVDRIEALEAHIKTEYPVEKRAPLDRELLVHMGQGVALLAMDVKKRAPHSMIKGDGAFVVYDE